MKKEIKDVTGNIGGEMLGLLKNSSVVFKSISMNNKGRSHTLKGLHFSSLPLRPFLFFFLLLLLLLLSLLLLLLF